MAFAQADNRAPVCAEPTPMLRVLRVGARRVVASAALAAAFVSMVPTMAHAYWYNGAWYDPPRPQYYRPPPPQVVWVPQHWNGERWVPGHWRPYY
jgi:hypothetical protein